MDKLLSKFYKDPSQPGSFSGIDTLYRSLKGRVKREDIKKWLEKKDSYTLHKPVRLNFKRNRVIVGGIDEQFQADLVDLQSLSKFNDGFKYLLTCIDVLSKFAWVIPIKDKNGKNVLIALQQIFNQRKPENLQTDKGLEFKNNIVQKYLRQENIHFFTTNNSTKASIVERFNRTLKTKMWKFFTEYNTHRYIDVIEKLVHSYNNTWHRSIKMNPSSVIVNNQYIVWNNLYAQKEKIKTIKPRLKNGDTVRISKEKLRFEKGYEQTFTREIFTVYKIIHRQPIVYKLKDLTGEVIEGTFYEQELQKITDSGYYPVEKILSTRNNKGKKEYLVKFQGYPEKFNAWVEDVKRI